MWIQTLAETKLKIVFHISNLVPSEKKGHRSVDKIMAKDIRDRKKVTEGKTHSDKDVREKQKQTNKDKK